jgi:hypothetical protein
MRKIGSLVICLSIFLSACAAGSSTSNSSGADTEQALNDTDLPAREPISQAEVKSISNSNASAANSAVASQQARRRNLTASQQISLIKAEQVNDSRYSIDRKIVRNADLDLEAESPESAQQKITTIAEMKGGFVVESQQNVSNIKATSRDIVTMTVRVPSDRFGEALDEIRKTSIRVVSEKVKGEDVTEEFIDVEAQLKAKKALEAQFMEIMKRAGRVDEALQVQSELADVRGEIEKIEGRLRFLENKSSLSTIKIRLQTGQVIASASQGFGGRFTESFNAGMNVATNFILGVVTFVVAILPFTLLVGLPLVLAFRYFWKRQWRPKSVSEIARDEIA